LIGGIKAIVRPGEKVLLKVNWCVVPEDPKLGVVTNPAVARAVADLIKEAGAEPIIGDSAARGVDTDLVLYDGTWAMEGLGPMYGIPFELNLILATRDVVAGDAVGICVPKEKRGKRWSKGCPPNNIYTIGAVTGRQMKDSYATDSNEKTT